MPRRREIFVQNGIYHIYNKAIEKVNVFTPEKVNLFINILIYYRSSLIDRRYSYFLEANDATRESIKIKLARKEHFCFECLAYCFMPNHFHLLLKQNGEKEINQILRKALSSFVHIYNSINKRRGPLFLPQFGAVEIHSEDQLKHVSRYIHLNPFSSGLVKNFEDLDAYPFSSLRSYLTNTFLNLCNTQLVLDLFGRSTERYRDFVHDQADYQKSLETIKQSLK